MGTRLRADFRVTREHSGGGGGRHSPVQKYAATLSNGVVVERHIFHFGFLGDLDRLCQGIGGSQVCWGPDIRFRLKPVSQGTPGSWGVTGSMVYPHPGFLR